MANYLDILGGLAQVAADEAGKAYKPLKGVGRVVKEVRREGGLLDAVREDRPRGGPRKSRGARRPLRASTVQRERSGGSALPLLLLLLFL